MDEEIIKLAKFATNQSAVNNKVIQCIMEAAKLLPAHGRTELVDALQELLDESVAAGGVVKEILASIEGKVAGK